MKVFLKYSFIFEPAAIWSTKEEFNKDLADYFKSKGCSTEIVKSAFDNPGELMIYLDKIPVESSIAPSNIKVMFPTQKQKGK